MVKKGSDIKDGLDGLFTAGKTTKKKRDKGRHSNPKQESHHTRATFHISQEDLKRIRALAWHERKSIKDIVREAFAGYFKGKTAKVNSALKSYRD